MVLGCGDEIEDKMNLPLIGITMGDPVGIGPEIIIKALSKPDIYHMCRPLIIGDETALDIALDILDSHLKIRVTEDMGREKYQPGWINLYRVSQISPEGLSFGQPTGESSRYMVTYIKEGTRLALEGKISALVTCAINKEAMNLAGFGYSGHTELLAALTGAKQYAMMFVSPSLRVVLVTIHCALCEVVKRLTAHTILLKIKITHQALRDYFGIKDPKIAVAALNPHGGEGGLFGKEEERVITPAIQKAKKMGIHAIGPLPPDSLFHQAIKGIYDVVVCMYHDQGLIPIKLLHFFEAVNVTLGLPIIRTSVAHGTAYDIAGKGIANPSSLISAIRLATKMAICQGRMW